MSDNWSLIKAEVDTYRNYLEKLPAAAAAEAKIAFLIKKEEIERLLAQKGPGTSLDGLRIYLGGNEIDGFLVPTIHIVATIKDGTNYSDYNVPKTLPAAGEAMLAAAAPADSGGGATGTTYPCPTVCNSKNILHN